MNGIRHFAVAAAVSSASAPPAAAVPPAVTPVPAAVAPLDDQSPAMLQQRGAAALRRITYPYQSLGYTIEFLPGRPGWFGRGYHEEKRIEIYVRPGESDDFLAHIVAHEIGHAIDFVYHTPARDQAWLTLRGVDPSTQWAPCGFCTDFGAPSGDFAETFALWQLGDVSQYRSTLAPIPAGGQLSSLARVFFP